MTKDDCVFVLLEHLKTLGDKGFDAISLYENCLKKVEAGKGCQAEPVNQEPVAIMSPRKAHILGINVPNAHIGTEGWIKLYAEPVR